MASKATFVLCAFAIIVESISAQCIGAINNFAGNTLAAEAAGLNSLAYPGGNLANYGLANGFVPSSGGSFAVTSYSPISPTGVTVVSENAIEGVLAVNGEIPFLGAVALEGALPSAGAGGINYGCGNGAIGIVSEGVAPGVGGYGAVAPGVGAYGPAGPGVAPGRIGYGAGLGFNGLPGGCGYNGVY